MDKQVRRLLNQKANKTQLANTIPDKQSMRDGESRFVIVNGALREYTKQHGQLFYIEYSKISVDGDFVENNLWERWMGV